MINAPVTWKPAGENYSFYDANGHWIHPDEIKKAVNNYAEMRVMCKKLLKALEIECVDPELGTARIIGEARKLLAREGGEGETQTTQGAT